MALIVILYKQALSKKKTTLYVSFICLMALIDLNEFFSHYISTFFL